MALDPDCLSRLRLTQDPFDERAGEAFLYTDLLLDQLLESAVELLEAPGAVLMLTGPAGSGRTLQLMRLLGLLPDRFELIAFRARPGTSVEMLEATLRAQLGADGRVARSLEQLLAQLLSTGAELCIAIDDAHHLGIDLVHALMRLRHGLLERTGEPPRLVLTGDPALARYPLQLESDDPGRISRLSLRPLNLEQARAYLCHRLEAAGLDNPLGLLADTDVESLHARSQGCPKELNTLAGAWLEARCYDVETGPRQPEPAPPPRQLAPETGEKTPEQLIAERIRALSASIDEHQDAPPAGAVARRGAPAEAVAGAAPSGRSIKALASLLRRTKGDQPASKAVRAGKSAAVPATPIWNQRWFVPAIAGGAALAILLPVIFQLQGQDPRPAPSSAPRDRARLLLESAEVAPPPRPRLAQPPGELSRPAPGAVMPPAPEPAPPRSLTQPPPREEPPAPAAPPLERPQPVAPAPPQPRSGIDLTADRDWLVAQNPNRYTIQLIAVSSLEAARDYVTRHRLDGVRFLPIRSRDRDFVVVLAGAFASRGEAERVYAALPDAVRADRPWIRAIGSVQGSLR
ncbi:MULTISPECIES: AAA family ATPase [unclassified Marichromatium]|uniref:AAA family ATPase n=1 Tax=unclassified Marichromatium TaxID=2618417 RepID=UPI000F3B1577|nr:MULTISPECIES: AAA family ATPase [unclassified Marichromatium]MBO8086196.1 SPOR domain-containing protein [Marichromatium sp.]RNE89747.1 sporulation protein [Marichromatium sp. AB31]RNE94301.1 sporulation protein [Marichromatium sp. AB32]